MLQNNEGSMVRRVHGDIHCEVMIIHTYDFNKESGCRHKHFQLDKPDWYFPITRGESNEIHKRSIVSRNKIFRRIFRGQEHDSAL
jgi:hypothetical protein